MSRTIRKPLMNGDDGDFGVYGSEAGCRSWAETFDRHTQKRLDRNRHPPHPPYARNPPAV